MSNLEGCVTRGANLVLKAKRDSAVLPLLGADILAPAVPKPYTYVRIVPKIGKAPDQRVVRARNIGK